MVRRIHKLLSDMEISSKLTVKFQNSGGETELVKILNGILKRKNSGSRLYVGTFCPDGHVNSQIILDTHTVYGQASSCYHTHCLPAEMYSDLGLELMSPFWEYLSLLGCLIPRPSGPSTTKTPPL